MMVTLQQPIWLLLAIPLAVVTWLWPAPTRLLQAMRYLVMGLIVLAMCWPVVKLPSRDGHVIVIADRSLSMPGDASTRHLELIELIRQGMGTQDRLGVVTFGQSAMVERPPDVGPVQPWVQEVVPDASNLSQAITRALALSPDDSPARLLILSDGKWTGQDPTGPASIAASRGIPIDYRHLGRPATSDLAIQQFVGPRSVSPGESFMLSAWVQTPTPQSMRYELRRGNAVIATGDREMPAGVSRLVFRDVARDESSTLPYTLSVNAGEEDPVPENNRARLLVGVQGANSLLVVSSSPISSNTGLASLLSTSGMKVTRVQPGDVVWSLENLSGHHGVVLENVPANTMTAADLSTLASWVEQTGSGLFMTGGRQSFGPGGYFKSPLDPVLPVSMELRQEHRKFSVAIVVALDRSGSMTAGVGGGKTKMDLANLGTSQVADMLSPMDELGVIAVDTQPHTIVEITSVTDRSSVQSQVLRIASQGGGIYVYNALEAAAAMVSRAQPTTKHIILFADAADSEEPGNYKSLLDQCEAAGITVSVIGLGKETDSDAALLKDVAARGRGRIYFTEDAMELPRLFAQDTFVVARSSFVEETTGFSITGGMVSIAGKNFTTPPAVGGYNLTYLRDGANLAGVTEDEYRAPLVASWQVGSGRSAVYTGEVDGRFTGPIAGWPSYGDMLTSVTRWTTGRNLPLPADMLIRQVVEGGEYRIELHLDPQRTTLDLPRLPSVSMLMGTPGQPPRAQQLSMRWTSPDTLSAQVTLQSTDTALATVDMGGLGVHTLPAVTLPYSPEYAPARDDVGQPTLLKIARLTAGKERLDVQGIWEDLTRLPRMQPVAHWVIILAIVMLLVEVFERRSGLIAMALSRVIGARAWLGRRASQDAGDKTATTTSQTLASLPRRRQGKLRQSPGSSDEGQGGAGVPRPGGDPPAGPAPSTSAPTTGGLAGAMEQARKRAGSRTSRGE